MTTAIPESPAHSLGAVENTAVEATEDAFSLDVQVVTDIDPGAAEAPCGTDDGCESTCASACNSGV